MYSNAKTCFHHRACTHSPGVRGRGRHRRRNGSPARPLHPIPRAFTVPAGAWRRVVPVPQPDGVPELACERHPPRPRNRAAEVALQLLAAKSSGYLRARAEPGALAAGQRKDDVRGAAGCSG